MKTTIGSAINKGRRVLLADGGSTKMDWLLLSEGTPIWRHTCKGVNPMTQGIMHLEETINTIHTIIPYQPDAIGYYGAGCIASICPDIESMLQTVFKCEAECGSDLLLAARLLSPDGNGLICILGTGSNSGLFKDGLMIKHTPSLGFIMGDEGGASYIGKRIITDCLRNRADHETMQFWENLNISEDEVIESIYRKNSPAAFLGDIAKKMQMISNKSLYISSLITSCLEDFFDKIITSYNIDYNTPIYFTGSIAYHFSTELKRIADNRNLNIASIFQKPFNKFIS